MRSWRMMFCGVLALAWHGVRLRLGGSVYVVLAERVELAFEISEQMILNNPQQGHYEVAKAHHQAPRRRHRQALTWADCATGDFGALEHWEAFAHPDFPKPFYHNAASNKSTFQPPCMAFEHLEMVFPIELEQFVVSTHQVTMESLDSHGVFRSIEDSATSTDFIALRAVSHAHEGDLDQDHELENWNDEEHDAMAFASELVFVDETTRDVYQSRLRPFFKFDQVLNNITGIASSFASPALTDEFKALYINNYAHIDLEEHRTQQVDEVVALEHLMLHFVPGWLMHTRDYTNRTEQWIEIRKLVPAKNRKLIAMAWEELGKMWLASGDAFLAMNSFRRALTWYPGLLPAYVEIAVILEFFKSYATSCAAVQSILSQVHVDEFDSSFPREILTSRFRHCDNLAWVLALWDENTFFRWFHIVSIGFSVLSSVCLMMGCCPAQIVIEENPATGAKKKKHDSNGSTTRSDDTGRKAKAK